MLLTCGSGSEFNFNKDPDPTFHFDANPDPAIFMRIRIFIKEMRTRDTRLQTPKPPTSIASLYGSRISLHGFQHPAFHIDPDPDPACHFDADTAFHSDTDPDPQNFSIGSIMYLRIRKTVRRVTLMAPLEVRRSSPSRNSSLPSSFRPRKRLQQKCKNAYDQAEEYAILSPYLGDCQAIS
jgi:hypothetical protein